MAGRFELDPESLERPLVIGAEINGANIGEVSNGFNGYVDEVRIYDRALSDEEIRALALVPSAQLLTQRIRQHSFTQTTCPSKAALVVITSATIVRTVMLSAFIFDPASGWTQSD